MKERVLTAARELGLDVDMTTLEQPTRTVVEAAKAVGCPPEKIAKSIVFIADGDPVVIVAGGARKIDPEALCRVLDCAHARVAAPDEVRAATGFSPGGVPPFAHGLPIVIDKALIDEGHIWAAGGDGYTVFEIDAAQLARATDAEVADIGVAEVTSS